MATVDSGSLASLMKQSPMSNRPCR
uniref:Uncharacterized protein n=1 Tax=Rhizophora mucronata TaxID=61149 RepID=A0A2P2IQP0_RHIMU